MKVAKSTRDAVKRLADDDGSTIDAEVALLARRERQRRMGDDLANWEPDADESAWLELGAREAR